MKRILVILFQLLFYCLVFWLPIVKAPTNGGIPSAQAAQKLPSSLLKAGFQIKLIPSLNPNLQKWLWIEAVGQEEGLSFYWVEGDGTNPSFFSNSAEDFRPRGRVSLPSWEQSARLWLPAFWPAAELFLANSSGLWLPPAQFEELLNKKSIPWIAPWTQGALSENSNLQAMISLALKQLDKGLQDENALANLSHQLQLKDKSEKYPIKLQGKDSEVEVILAEDLWARYTILKDPQNPLVLKVEFAPDVSLGHLLFSPLSWLKTALEHEVIELNFSGNF